MYMFVCNIHMQVNILIFITCIYMYMKVYELFICMLKYTTQPFQSCNRHIFKIIITTPTLIKHITCEVWLSITDATECSFFATFWTSWSNLTVTSNSYLNLGYQLHVLQAQHPLKSASERYFSLVLPTSLSL